VSFHRIDAGRYVHVFREVGCAAVEELHRYPGPWRHPSPWRLSADLEFPPQCSDVFVSRGRRVQEKLDAVRLRLAGTAADGFVRSLAVYEKPRDGETRVRVKGLEEKGVHFNGRMGHVLGIVPGLKAEDKTRFRSVVAREKSSVSG
jgi:hypothetical protein